MQQNTPHSNNSYTTGESLSIEAVKERQYLWMARTFALVLVVSVITTFMLISSMLSLLPIVRVQPFFLTTLNKDQQVINVIRPDYKTINMELLSESFIRHYLLSYFSMSSNVAELERRWGIDGDINWMSETSVFSKFGEVAKIWIKQAKSEGLTRNVNILVITPFRANKNENIWRAELEFVEMKHGAAEPVKSKWVATMKIDFKPTRPGLIWEQRLKNPLGFTVLNIGFKPADSK